MLYSDPNLTSIAGGAAKIDWLQCPAPDIIYSQRCRHYCRYPQARHLLETLRRKPGSAAFISLVGCHSVLNENYPDAGLNASNLWQSEFGNLKIIAARPA